MNRSIIWENLNIESNVLTGMVEEIEEIDEEDFEEEFLEEGDELQQILDNSQQIITSPFGIFHVKDFFNPMRQFNWHMGHFNFNISKSVLEVLNNIEGIEKGVLLSKYRILVAFGKAFSTKQVKNTIYKTLNASPPLSEEAQQKVEDLKSIYDKWAIYFVDDDFESCNEEDFDEQILKFREQQKRNGGIVLTHETDI